MEDAKKALVACIDAIDKVVMEVMTEHWALVGAGDKAAESWADKSALNLAHHKAGNSIQAKWYAVRWAGKKGARAMLRINIRKLRGDDTYSMAELRKYAKDWEWPIVEKTELKLAMLRKQAGFCAKALTSLRHAEMAEQKYKSYLGKEAAAK